MTETRAWLTSPKMLALHALVLVVVLVLGRLGIWQLDRLGEVRERNDALAARSEQPPEPVGELLSGLDLGDTEQLAELEYRAVAASGTWRTGGEVLQRGRSLQGRSGFHVLTPLELDGGGTVVVRRGWIPFTQDPQTPAPDAAPPAPDARVSGYLERSIPQPTGPLAQRDPPEGELDVVFNADLGRLGPQLPGDVLPMVLHLESQEPAAGELPVPAPRPEEDEGTHLSYAVQWFAFAVIGLAFYVVWLRRRARGDTSVTPQEVTRG